MSINHNDRNTSTTEPVFSNAYNEIINLVDMATSIQCVIKEKRREIRFSIVKLLVLLYFFVAIPIFLKPLIVSLLGFNGYLSILVFALTTLLLLSVIMMVKLRELRSELKINIATMQDLMDVIFNFRKLFNNFEKHGLSVVEVTILDLKLRQLRFY